MSEATIFHNPQCSTSRRGKALLEERGLDIEVVKYLVDTPTAAELKALYERAGISVHDGVRTKEAVYKELGLSPETPEEELLRAMVENPRLIERPIVATAKGVRIGRPVEVIEEIL
ncbi:Arsenate reductase [Corynebacterium occultum]|uniref:Arsenate reductase n=1 Tax=Corynebacterium occultum TaxID=2675219 RepID=A0A6B8W6P4_9CORY|nr:arsenate reductase (glutaredoxin) [Corynebacterium occultum]QGU06985.1 Arsenate reductase [Corynebacterium occultum]